MVKAGDIPSSIELIPHMPYPLAFVREYISLQQELEQVKQRLSELEAKERVIVLKEITREEAKKEIQQLFASGRTLYYSDIVTELKLDLETVVDICNELQKNKDIGIDDRVSQVG